MTDILYRWPQAAKFGRRVPKEKLYARGAASTAARERLVAEVGRITWAYKLAEATINLPGTPAVPEVQVFTIDAKTRDVSEAVLGAIDRAIPFPIIFEVTRPVAEPGSGGAVVRMVAAHKQVGSGTPKIGPYYSTSWQAAGTARQELPTAITLTALYVALLQPLTPLAARPGEEMSEVAGRLAAVRGLEREVAALERKLRTEPQFNRQVELRRALKARQRDLAALVEG